MQLSPIKQQAIIQLSPVQLYVQAMMQLSPIKLQAMMGLSPTKP